MGQGAGGETGVGRGSGWGGAQEGKQSTRNKGEQEMESDDKTSEDIFTK